MFSYTEKKYVGIFYILAFINRQEAEGADADMVVTRQVRGQLNRLALPNLEDVYNVLEQLCAARTQCSNHGAVQCMLHNL